MQVCCILFVCVCICYTYMIYMFITYVHVCVGAGKSTVISMLTGLMAPDAGTAIIEGYVYEISI